MGSRIIWGLALGLLFLFVTLQSLPWVLLAFGVVHLLAQLEFTSLLRGAPRAWCWLHALVTTLVWVVVSRSLLDTGALRLDVAAAILAPVALALAYAIVATQRYQAGAAHRDHYVLLRSLLFITLPMACIPVVVVTGGEYQLYLLLIGASWGADTGAIFVGKLLGKTRLCPRLSPKKTVVGVVGGALAAGLIWAGAVALYGGNGILREIGFTGEPWLEAAVMVVLGACLSLVGLFGDLTFSMFKREAELKDYGAAIPGHGGVLDRFDSMLFVAPVLLLFAVVG